MTSHRNQIRQDASDGVGIGLGAGAILAIVVGVILLLGLAVWGFTVATAELKGKGDARVTTESGVNRLGQQEFFERTYQDIEQQRGIIAQHKQTLESGALDPRTAQTNLSGAIQHCLSMVGDYNAKARTQRAEQFRAADLPASIDSTTTCQEA